MGDTDDDELLTGPRPQGVRGYTALMAAPIAKRPSPGWFQLGAPIGLADLLALPPDGFNYTRDAEGRLALVTPDHLGRHRVPLGELVRHLNLQLGRPWRVLPEPTVAFDQVWDLAGTLLPDSFLGPKAIAPDIAVFRDGPTMITGAQGLELASPEKLVLAVELLSPSTWRSDLGLGTSRDVVDRPRTYLAGGMHELWQLNGGVEDEACPVPRRAARCLRRSDDGARWVEVPLADGAIRSQAVPGLVLELEPFWRDCGL